MLQEQTTMAVAMFTWPLIRMQAGPMHDGMQLEGLGGLCTNRRCYPGQALNQPRWRTAGMPRPSQGIGEDHGRHAGQRAGDEKVWAKGWSRLWSREPGVDRQSGYATQPPTCVTQYIYSVSKYYTECSISVVTPQSCCVLQNNFRRMLTISRSSHIRP